MKQAVKKPEVSSLVQQKEPEVKKEDNVQIKNETSPPQQTAKNVSKPLDLMEEIRLKQMGIFINFITISI